MPAASAPARQAPAMKVVDEGQFVLTLGNDKVGTESFTISEGNDQREIKTHSALSFNGNQQVADGNLTTDASWRPLKAEFVQGGQTLTLERVDGILVLGNGGKSPMKEEKRSDLFVLNRTVSHLTPVCSLAPAAGDKDIEATLFPGLSLTINAPKTVKLFHDNRTTEVALVNLILDDTNRVTVICDGPKALLIAAGGVIATREGYEDVRAQVMAAQYEKPRIPETLVETAVKVTGPGHPDLGDGEAQLACSLVAPAKRPAARIPAAVFVTGSGPQDRDEDTPDPTVRMSIFKVMAIALGQAGIASLRCDDRGVGESTLGSDPSKLTLTTYVDDVRAMVAAVRKQPGIDGARIAIIGHSEGGEVAPMVAEADAKVKALVLMAAMGRNLAEISYEQQEAAARRLGATDEQIREMHAHYVEAYAAIKAGQPLPDSLPPLDRKALEPLVPWLASHFRHEPAETARKLSRLPVFIGQGDKDFQVSSKDAQILRDAFQKGGNKRVTYKLYAGLNHMFTQSKTGTLADYSDPDLHVDAQFVNDVVSFLKKSL
jgi:pimeloyl-ACP methyl ester carboxylesterase